MYHTGTAFDENRLESNPVQHWVQKGNWPGGYFKQEQQQTRKDLEQYSWLEENRHEDWFKEQFGSVSNMSHLLAKLKPSNSLRRRNSGSSSSAASDETPSDQKPRDVKSAPYKRPSYATILATKGSFMDKSDLGVTNASRSFCRTLLEKSRRFLMRDYSAMTCSTKLAERYRTGTKLKLFRISPGFSFLLPIP